MRDFLILVGIASAVVALFSLMWFTRNYLGGTVRRLSERAKASAPRARKSVGEIEAFVAMLAAACENKMVHDRLERLLTMPDEKRQAVVHAWVRDLLVAKAPRDFVQAIGCLLDDRVAEKAYEVIFKCKRGERG